MKTPKELLSNSTWIFSSLTLNLYLENNIVIYILPKISKNLGFLLVLKTVPLMDCHFYWV